MFVQPGILEKIPWVFSLHLKSPLINSEFTPEKIVVGKMTFPFGAISGDFKKSGIEIIKKFHSPKINNHFHQISKKTQSFYTIFIFHQPRLSC